MKERFFRIKAWLAYLIFVLLDLICIAAGMGVPVFCILLGFPVGWFIARRFLYSEYRLAEQMRKMFLISFATSVFTFAVMVILWGRMVIMLFDPTVDLVNFGIPMILYEPRPSFAGWMVLMIIISPFLQLLTTIFAAFLTVTARLRRLSNSSGSK